MHDLNIKNEYTEEPNVQSFTMSANIGIVKINGVIYRVAKSPFETDERLYDRAWFCAKKGCVDNVTQSQSHMWANEKYFKMKYIDNNGN